jgi:hypothetical protein
MIKALAEAPLLFRLWRWMCVCVPKRSLDAELRARIRPLTLGWLACWCDRSVT